MNKQAKTKKTEKEKKNAKVIQVNNKKKTVNSLAKIPLKIPKCELSKTYLKVDASMTTKEFINVWDCLQQVNGAVQWWIGDWINLARDKHKFASTVQVENILNSVYSDGYLKNLSWVAWQIPESRRRENLSFSHHQEVAPLSEEEQEHWFDKAEKEHCSVKKLRAEIATAKIEQENQKKLEDKTHVYVKETSIFGKEISKGGKL